MAQTAAEVLIEALQDWGVDTVFGLPGDGINGLMEALRKKRDAIRFIQVCAPGHALLCGGSTQAAPVFDFLLQRADEAIGNLRLVAARAKARRCRFLTESD